MSFRVTITLVTLLALGTTSFGFTPGAFADETPWPDDLCPTMHLEGLQVIEKLEKQREEVKNARSVTSTLLGWTGCPRAYAELVDKELLRLKSVQVPVKTQAECNEFWKAAGRSALLIKKWQRARTEYASPVCNESAARTECVDCQIKAREQSLNPLSKETLKLAVTLGTLEAADTATDATAKPTADSPTSDHPPIQPSVQPSGPSAATLKAKARGSVLQTLAEQAANPKLSSSLRKAVQSRSSNSKYVDTLTQHYATLAEIQKWSPEHLAEFIAKQLPQALATMPTQAPPPHSLPPPPPSPSHPASSAPSTPKDPLVTSTPASPSPLPQPATAPSLVGTRVEIPGQRAILGSSPPEDSSPHPVKLPEPNAASDPISVVDPLLAGDPAGVRAPAKTRSAAELLALAQKSVRSVRASGPGVSGSDPLASGSEWTRFFFELEATDAAAKGKAVQQEDFNHAVEDHDEARLRYQQKLRSIADPKEKVKYVMQELHSDFLSAFVRDQDRLLDASRGYGANTLAQAKFIVSTFHELDLEKQLLDQKLGIEITTDGGELTYDAVLVNPKTGKKTSLMTLIESDVGSHAPYDPRILVKLELDRRGIKTTTDSGDPITTEELELYKVPPHVAVGVVAPAIPTDRSMTPEEVRQMAVARELLRVNPPQKSADFEKNEKMSPEDRAKKSLTAAELLSLATSLPKGISFLDALKAISLLPKGFKLSDALSFLAANQDKVKDLAKMADKNQLDRLRSESDKLRSAKIQAELKLPPPGMWKSLSQGVSGIGNALRDLGGAIQDGVGSLTGEGDYPQYTNRHNSIHFLEDRSNFDFRGCPDWGKCSLGDFYLGFSTDEQISQFKSLKTDGARWKYLERLNLKTRQDSIPSESETKALLEGPLHSKESLIAEMKPGSAFQKKMTALQARYVHLKSELNAFSTLGSEVPLTETTQGMRDFKANRDKIETSLTETYSPIVKRYEELTSQILRSPADLVAAYEQNPEILPFLAGDQSEFLDFPRHGLSTLATKLTALFSKDPQIFAPRLPARGVDAVEGKDALRIPGKDIPSGDRIATQEQSAQGAPRARLPRGGGSSTDRNPLERTSAPAALPFSRPAPQAVPQVLPKHGESRAPTAGEHQPSISQDEITARDPQAGRADGLFNPKETKAAAQTSFEKYYRFLNELPIKPERLSHQINLNILEQALKLGRLPNLISSQFMAALAMLQVDLSRDELGGSAAPSDLKKYAGPFAFPFGVFPSMHPTLAKFILATFERQIALQSDHDEAKALGIQQLALYRQLKGLPPVTPTPAVSRPPTVSNPPK